MQPFLKIAHRGYSARYPENTLIAFAKAVEAGADMIELDVHCSKDGHLVVIHDGRIDRTSDGTGRVADKTLAELRQYNYANGRASFGFVKIPTLAEVIDQVGNRVPLNIEIKSDPPRRLETVEGLAELLELKDFKERAIVSSFDHRALAEMKRLAADIKTGMLTDEVWVTFTDECLALDVSSVHPGPDAIDADQLRWAKARGLKVFAWGVWDKETLDRCRSSGFIDGVMVDDLELF